MPMPMPIHSCNAYVRRGRGTLPSIHGNRSIRKSPPCAAWHSLSLKPHQYAPPPPLRVGAAGAHQAPVHSATPTMHPVCPTQCNLCLPTKAPRRQAAKLPLGSPPSRLVLLLPSLLLLRPPLLLRVQVGPLLQPFPPAQARHVRHAHQADRQQRGHDPHAAVRVHVAQRLQGGGRARR